MRVATWNVNGLRARLDFVLHWLAERQPDVVGFQELKLKTEQFPFAAFEQLGYRSLVHGQPSWNGVAILTREAAQPVCSGLPGAEAQGARLISARIGDLTFTTVYVPNGKTLTHDDFPHKLAWLDRLAKHLRERHDPAGLEILCGDFNIVPQPIDSWDEAPDRIFHTPQERARLEALFELGWTDLYRAQHPGRQFFSWWDYRGGAFHRNLGLRIDLILGTHQVAKRVTSIEVDRDYRKKKEGWTASDHAPVILEFA